MIDECYSGSIMVLYIVDVRIMRLAKRLYHKDRSIIPCALYES